MCILKLLAARPHLCSSAWELWVPALGLELANCATLKASTQDKHIKQVIKLVRDVCANVDAALKLQTYLRGISAGPGAMTALELFCLASGVFFLDCIQVANSDAAKLLDEGLRSDLCRKDAFKVWALASTQALQEALPSSAVLRKWVAPFEFLCKSLTEPKEMKVVLEAFSAFWKFLRGQHVLGGEHLEVLIDIMKQFLAPAEGSLLATTEVWTALNMKTFFAGPLPLVPHAVAHKPVFMFCAATIAKGMLACADASADTDARGVLKSILDPCVTGFLNAFGGILADSSLSDLEKHELLWFWVNSKQPGSKSVMIGGLGYLRKLLCTAASTRFSRPWLFELFCNLAVLPTLRLLATNPFATSYLRSGMGVSQQPGRKAGAESKLCWPLQLAYTMLRCHAAYSDPPRVLHDLLEPSILHSFDSALSAIQSQHRDLLISEGGTFLCDVILREANSSEHSMCLATFRLSVWGRVLALEEFSGVAMSKLPEAQRSMKTPLERVLFGFFELLLGSFGASGARAQNILDGVLDAEHFSAWKSAVDSSCDAWAAAVNVLPESAGLCGSLSALIQDAWLRICATPQFSQRKAELGLFIGHFCSCFCARLLPAFLRKDMAGSVSRSDSDGGVLLLYQGIESWTQLADLFASFGEMGVGLMKVYPQVSATVAGIGESASKATDATNFLAQCSEFLNKADWEAAVMSCLMKLSRFFDICVKESNEVTFPWANLILVALKQAALVKPSPMLANTCRVWLHSALRSRKRQLKDAALSFWNSHLVKSTEWSDEWKAIIAEMYQVEKGGFILPVGIAPPQTVSTSGSPNDTGGAEPKGKRIRLNPEKAQQQRETNRLFGLQDSVPTPSFDFSSQPEEAPAPSKPAVPLILVEDKKKPRLDDDDDGGGGGSEQLDLRQVVAAAWQRETTQATKQDVHEQQKQQKDENPLSAGLFANEEQSQKEVKNDDGLAQEDATDANALATGFLGAAAGTTAPLLIVEDGVGAAMMHGSMEPTQPVGEVASAKRARDGDADGEDVLCVDDGEGQSKRERADVSEWSEARHVALNLQNGFVVDGAASFMSPEAIMHSATMLLHNCDGASVLNAELRHNLIRTALNCVTAEDVATVLRGSERSAFVHAVLSAMSAEDIAARLRAAFNM